MFIGQNPGGTTGNFVKIVRTRVGLLFPDIATAAPQRNTQNGERSFAT